MSNIILTIDTSINYCSVAIYKKKIIYSLAENCKKKHTFKILPMINKILKIAKITLKDLNYIGFGNGPGTFTGIRIAIGIAQSLSISLKIPVFAISTLSILAEKAWRKHKEKNILVAVNAKIGKIYWGKYTRNDIKLWTGENTEALIKINEIEKKIKNLTEKWTLVGEGWNKIKLNSSFKFKRTKILYPNAIDIIPFCLSKINNKELSKSTTIKNNYLDNLF